MITRKAHKPDFETFPSVKSGENVALVEIDTKYPKWFLGETGQGVRGYFPLDWFRDSGDSTHMEALTDYDARELEVAAGAEVEVLKEYGEWRLVTCGSHQGWVPANIF